MKPTRTTFLALTLLAALAALTPMARADFGILPKSLKATATNRDGTTATQAGSHPYAFNVQFKLKTDGSGNSEGGEMRDVISHLPPGLIGNPLATPRCPRQSFEGGLPQCDPDTQVGVLSAILPGIGEAFGPVYNLVPPPGAAAQLGFKEANLTALISATVSSEDDYSVRIIAPDLPVPVTQASATIWGVPADPGHNPERGVSGVGGPTPTAEPLPFLTLPTACESPPKLSLEVDSKLAPGIFTGEPALLSDNVGGPVTLSECEAVPFKPEVSSGPSTSAAESPSGLGFRLGLPNEGLLNPEDGVVSETEPVRTEVTLPEGMIANPAAVNGQGVCTSAEFKAAKALSGPQQGCPQSSKLGTLIANSPLLDEPIEGSLYLAAPHDNPFNSLLALYIVAAAPQRGILVKQAGLIEADPVSGQLTTTIDDLPPAPYSSLEVHLREGPRAPLITPQTCGPHTTTAKLYPFSDPETATVKSVPFTIFSGPNGGACANSTAELPFAPALMAGTTIPIAGAHSPFVFELTRNDGEQRLGGLEATLPQGLSAKLAGIPYCPEAGIAQAIARSGEGQGALELSAPSCPPASQIGTAVAGAGAGPSPYYVQGSAYLAGPYKGAPLSTVIITPAIAGPFDLGVVVVRAALYVNESTGQVTAKSDPLPQILHGLPLDVRSVSLRMDRSGFVLNPTSCEVKAISATAFSVIGTAAALSNRFQVDACKGLGFSPKLKLSLKGATKRAGHPAFKAVLTQPAGQANIARVSVALPPTEFLDQAHVSNPCTRPQFAAGTCPPSSILGRIRAITPLLDAPLEGPIYFRSNGGERELPDVVADLGGQVHLIQVGFVDAIHKKGSEQSRIRTTFATVPDAPVQKIVIELKSGKKNGLLVNSANICKTPNRAIVKMRAQNGKSFDSKPRVATSCGKKGKKGKKKGE